MFVCIIVNAAEDSYHKKVTKETIVSFLGGLEGVAAISHILVKDTLENHAIDSKDCSECDRAVDRARLEYVGKMNILKHEFMTAQMTDAYQVGHINFDRSTPYIFTIIILMFGSCRFCSLH
jgi:hypothetical protein